MALEAVVFPQDLFGCSARELHRKAGEVWGYDLGGGPVEEQGRVPLECNVSGGHGGGVVRTERTVVDGMEGTWDVSSPLPEIRADAACATAAGQRKRRRRTKSFKNQEEVENQRMTHIAVERNRRKQMNEYLAVLRSLMPAAYSQRGDQASVVGGAINFVKELEKLVQSLEVHKRIKQRPTLPPFADFFTFPQYSSRCAKTGTATGDGTASEAAAESPPSSAADIEVTMVETHANLKILARRQPKQLLQLVVGLQNLHLTALHLNITTIDEMVFYSFSLKVEDQCRLTSVDDIAAAVHAIVRGIQGQAAFD